MRIFLAVVGLVALVNLSGCAGSKDMKENPSAEVHYNIGISYLKEPNPAMALKSFLEAERIAPSDAKIQDALGQAYMQKRAFLKAEEHFKRALELSKDDPLYMNNLAALYMESERYDEAIDYFDRAAHNLFFSHPENAFVGKGYAHYKKHNFLEAVTAYSKALEYNPRYALAHFRMGEAYYALDKASLAVASFTRAVELSPNSAVAHYHRGVALVKMRQVTEARAAFRQVVKLDAEGQYGRQAADYLKILK